MNIIKLHALPPSDFIGNSIFSNPVPTNTPFLADKDSGKVIEPVLHFILAQTKVSNSNEARCDDLKDWFIYLDAFELNWLDANDEDLDQYQEIMESTVSSRNEPYSKATIKRRTTSIVQFYRYWKRKGVYKHDIEEIRESNCHLPSNDNALAHLGNGKAIESSAYDRLGSAKKSPPKVFTPKEWQAFSPKLGPQTNAHRLIWEVALQTGARIHEVLKLTKYDIQALVTDPTLPYVTQPILCSGKGGKDRNLLFPNWLIDTLNEYILNERANAVNNARKKHKKYKEPAELFLTLDHTKFAGSAVSQRTALRHFNKAVIAAGYIIPRIKINPDTGETYYVHIAKYTGHCTRHSFAVWTYYSRKEQGDSEPWKFIQIRLGHESVRTTQKTYLKATDEFEARISDTVFKDLREKALGGVTL